MQLLSPLGPLFYPSYFGAKRSAIEAKLTTLSLRELEKNLWCYRIPEHHIKAE